MLNKASKQIKQRGFFGGEFSVRTSEYHGADTSKACFLFPGQGAAFPGMFESELKISPVLKNRFQIADRLAAKNDLQPVSSFILKPKSISEKMMPLYRNLATFTVEVALFEDLVLAGLRPALVTGHSFGEFAALVASGIATFEETFEIIMAREKSCPAPGSLGAMIATSCSEVQIVQILSGMEYSIANVNAPNQTVVSCPTSSVKDILSVLRGLKIPAVHLEEVPQPYHSPLLREATEKFSKELDRINPHFQPPYIPLLSSVSREIITDRNFIGDKVHTNLKRQMLEQLRFSEQIEKAKAFGTIHFVEAGPGQALSGFVRATLQGQRIKVRHYTDAVSLPTSVEKKQGTPIRKISINDSKVARLFNKALAAVTGYSIEEIGLEDRFQEELGIDSIKKAAIIFQVVENLASTTDHQRIGVNLTELVTIQDILRYFNSLEKQRENDGSGARSDESQKARRFSTFEPEWTERPMPGLFAGANLANSSQIFLLAPNKLAGSEVFEEVLSFLEDKENPTLVFDCREVSTSFLDLEHENLFDTFRPLVSLFKKLAECGLEFKLALVGDTQGSATFFEPFLRSWAIENPGVFFKLIEMARGQSPQSLSDLVATEMNEPSSGAVRYEGGQRWVREFNSGASVDEIEPNLRDFVIVSLGGMRGIGWEILKGLNSGQAPSLYVVGQTSGDSTIIQKKLAFVRESNPNIEYESVDTSDAAALDACLKRILDKHGRIDLILNGVGSQSSRLLKEKSWSEIQSEFLAKAKTTINLLKFAGQSKVEQIIHHSSVAGQLGNLGQSIYSLTNSFVQRASHEFNLKNKAISKVILWPAWDNVGMTEDLATYRSLKIAGLSMLDKAQGVKFLLSQIGGLKSGQVLYMSPSYKYVHVVNAIDKRGYRPLMDKVEPTEGSVELPGLTLAHQAYLRDHSVTGLYVYPASGQIALFLWYGYLLWGRFPVLTNFIAHRFAVVNEDQSGFWLEVERRGEGLHLSLRSTVVHAECDIQNSIPTQELKTTKMEGRRWLETPQVNIEEVYNLGPKFNPVLSRFWVNSSNELTGELRHSSIGSYSGIEGFDHLFRICEAVHRTVAVKYWWELKTQNIPKSVQKIVPLFQSPHSDRSYIQMISSEMDDMKIAANVHARNSKGDVLMEFHGVEIVSMGANEKRDFNIHSIEDSPLLLV